MVANNLRFQKLSQSDPKAKFSKNKSKRVLVLALITFSSKPMMNFFCAISQLPFNFLQRVSTYGSTIAETGSFIAESDFKVVYTKDATCISLSNHVDIANSCHLWIGGLPRISSINAAIRTCKNLY